MMKYKDTVTRHIFAVDSLSTVVLDGIVNLDDKVEMLPVAGGPGQQLW